MRRFYDYFDGTGCRQNGKMSIKEGRSGQPIGAISGK
jgi:hypothetical protein